MHVTRTHHWRVVGILGVVIVFLLCLLGIELFRVSTLEYQQNDTATGSFLNEEEAVIVGEQDGTDTQEILPVKKVLFQYVEVTGSCGPHFEGECMNVRSGPGTDYPVVTQLRNHVVLKVGGEVERDGYEWYKVVFDEQLRYSERVTSDWYIAADYVTVLLDEGDKTLSDNEIATNTKQIIVDRTHQMLYAYDGDQVFMEIPISTGLELTPTPRGTFTIFKKTPSRYMQGPLPGISDQYYDLPGVPWNLYFTHQGAVIHGAYWHNSFGKPYSHGCVNLPPDKAKELYDWAGLGTKVTVMD